MRRHELILSCSLLPVRALVRGGAYRAAARPAMKPDPLWLWGGVCGNRGTRKDWGSLLSAASEHQLVLTQLVF